MFDPLTWSEVSRLRRDRPMAPRAEAAVNVNANSYFTLGEQAGPIGGELVALVLQLPDAGTSVRAPQDLRVTVDGLSRESPGFASAIRPAAGAGAAKAILPLGGRFRRSFKVEVKGSAASGSFAAQLLWAEEG